MLAALVSTWVVSQRAMAIHGVLEGVEKAEGIGEIREPMGHTGHPR